jgi:hypothetical protein
MQPFRTVRSEVELEAVVSGSLVSAAYSLRTIFEKQNTNEWVEPGSEETWTTASVWEFMTGAYEHLVLDEDREVWVLIDAAAPELVRPPRTESSPDYATRVSSRTPEIATHATLDDARAAIEEAVGDGVTVCATNIWGRQRDQWLLSPMLYIEPGTSAAEFPWAR